MENLSPESNGTQTKAPTWILIGVTLLLLAGAAYAYTNSSTKTLAPTSSSSTTQTVASPTTSTGSAMTDETVAGEVKEIKINGTNMTFDPDTITVKKGTKIRVTLTNTDSSDEWEIEHDFVIDELNVASEMVGEGKSTSIAFTADTVGEFEYYCSVGDHRDMGMVGKLIVTE